ncbi:MAG: 30S ribosomal protein S8 [Deltaproteobacteria bacterium]|nr:30S ribosomal protein S8 [Deltaproteobacteria bacterium]
MSAITDPIADFLTRIRNAILARHPAVEIPRSKIKVGLAELLKNEGYIQDYMILDDRLQGLIRIELKFLDDGQLSAITGIERVSRPGRRIYAGATEIPRVLDGLGVSIVSTSKGLMTDRAARAANLGGEVLCRIW